MRHGRLLLLCYLTTLLILTGIEAALGFDISRTQVRQIDFTKQLQPATKCAEGRIASYEYELDPKAVTFVEGMYCFCQVIIFHKSITEPDYGREAKWKLYDVIARPAYVPIGHFRGVTPFCVTGQRTTVCFCSGNGCFWDAWSVVDFLLQTYRYNIGGEAEKLKNYRFDDYKDDKKFRINALHSVTSGLRKSFQFETVLPDIPLPLDDTLNKANQMLDLWNKFDKEKKKLFKMGRKLAGSLVPDGDDEDDEEDASKDGGGGGNKKNKKKGKNDGKGGNSANETAIAEEKSKDGRKGKKGGKNDKAKKSRIRLFYVIAFMGGLNAFSFLLILTFFIWYKKSAKKGGLGQTVGETGKDTDDTGGGAAPAVTPQGEAPAASSSTPSKGPTDAGAPSGPDGANPPLPQQGGTAPPPGQDGAPPHPQGAGEMLENGYFVSEQVTI